MPKRPHPSRSTADESAHDREPLSGRGPGRGPGGARPRRRGRRRLLIGAVCLSCLVATLALAPQLVCVPVIRGFVLDRVARQLAGPARVEGLRLGWFRPVVIERLELLTPDEQPLARIGCLRTELPLWQLVRSRSALGVVHLQDCEAWLRVRPGGSDWEDYLAALPPTPETSSALPQLQLRIDGGTLHISDSRGDTARLERLEAWIDVPAGGKSPLTFAAQLRLPAVADAPGTGQLQLQGSWSAPADNSAAGPDAALKVRLESLPVELTRFLAVRYQHATYAEGIATGEVDVRLQLADAWPVDQFVAQVTVAPLRIVLPGDAAETLHLPTATLNLRAAAREGHLQLEQCELTSPIASATLTTQFALSAMPPTGGDLWSWVAQQAFQLKGQLDLAMLANQLPRALRLRDDVQLSSGTIQCELSNQPSGGGSHRLSGQFEAAGLAAQHGGERFELRDPIQVRFRAGVDAEGPVVEQVVAQAPFLQLDARGRWQQGELRGAADLTQLMRQLSQFFDFGQVQLAGQARGAASWQTTTDEAWQLSGELAAEGLQVAGLAPEPWHDDRLRLVFQAGGRFAGWQPTSLQTASLQCDADADQLVAQLTAPVSAPWSAAEWPLELRLSGELARWQARVGWIVPQPLPRIAGQVKLQATARAAHDQIVADPLQISLREFRCTTPQRTLSEAALELTASGIYHLADGLVECHTATLASSAVSLKADTFRWSPSGAVPWQGNVQFRGDLARIWQKLAASPLNRPLGNWTGQAQVAATAEGSSIRATSRIEKFQWQTRAVSTVQNRPDAYRTLWQEPSVQLDLTGQWATADNHLTIADGRCQTESFAVQMAGQLMPLDTPCRADLQGSSTLNLDELSLRLRPWLGPSVQLSGSVAKPFRLSGPLQSPAASTAATVQMVDHNGRPKAAWVPAELEAEFGVGWQSVRAYGIEAGASSLDARLHQQMLTVSPMELPVGQGRIRLVPNLQLTPPFRVSLDKGSVVEQVAITPEMCHSWLRYVAPLVADATSAEGLLSLRVAQAEVPLVAPRAAIAAGALTIHRAHLGPGPLAQQMLTVVNTVRALVEPGRTAGGALDVNARWIELPEQVVPFRVENGQVTHQNLTMQVGEVTVRTSGWVAFNQRMDLLAEVPVLDRWVANQPYLAGLRGQTLKIPVRGTLQQPVLDQRALQSITQQTLRGAAQGYLQQELQRQLQQLLPNK